MEYLSVAAGGGRSLRYELVEDARALAQRACERVLEVLRREPEPVLVLPTGRTPQGMYACLASSSSAARDWWRARLFNLDEYLGVSPQDAGSYASYMRRHLTGRVAVRASRCHVPDGEAAARGAQEAARVCAEYEALLSRHGPAHLAVLGLGHNGHIAFNEPGSGFGSRTRVVELTASTREANRSSFPGGEVPTHAVTMGIGTILESRRIVLLVSGASKSGALARLARGEVDERFPASALHLHGDVTVIMDRAALS